MTRDLPAHAPFPEAGTPEALGRPVASAWFAAIFFVSGAAALVFETLWFRLASLTFGNGVEAAAIVLSSFMAGLALGNGLAMRFGGRPARPLRAYAAIEAVTAGSGIGLVLLFPHITPFLAPMFRRFAGQPDVVNWIRLLVAGGLMLVPATAMGLTLPVLAGGISRAEKNFGRALGMLYGWNTLGAVAGALAGEVALLAWCGVTGSGLVAAGMNLAAAAAALWLSGRLPGAPAGAPASGTAQRGGPPVSGRHAGAPIRLAALAAAAGLAGAAFLALEVVWFRFLLLSFNAYGWNFTVMLAVILAGIGAGGLAASRWFRRRPEAHLHAAAAAAAGGTLVVLGYALFGKWAGQFAALPEHHRIIPAAPFLMFPLSLLSGILFTQLGQAIRTQLDSPVRAAGLLTLANTLGAAVGPLAAGFWLIPVLGVERSFLILAVVYGTAGLLVLAGQGIPAAVPARLAAAGAALSLAVALAAFPHGLMRSAYLPAPAAAFLDWDEKPVAVREGQTETIQVLRRDLAGEPYYYRLVTNNHSMSANGMRDRRYMELFALWPGIVHPAPRKALLICYGIGTTARALVRDPRLESIDVVDISRDILAMSRVIFPDPRRNPTLDPRVRLHVEDGRFFLQAAAVRYDIITAEPPPPLFAGVDRLYSREYFRLMADRLAEGGVATYWLPVYQLPARDARTIVRAFLEAFPQASLWTGAGLDWMLVGVKGPGRPASPAAFLRPWGEAGFAGELAAIGLERPECLGATFIADGERLRAWVGGAAPLADNFPRRLSDREADLRTDLDAYRQFMNAPEAAANFAGSPLIRRLWPDDLRRDTVAWFPRQRILNEIMSVQFLLNLFPRLQAGMSDPAVVNAVFWQLRSDGYLAPAILARHPGAPPTEEGVCLCLAQQAILRGNFRAAEALFGLADRARPASVYTAMRIYLRLRLGDQAGAAALVPDFRARLGPAERPGGEAYLEWVHRAFPPGGAGGPRP